MTGGDSSGLESKLAGMSVSEGSQDQQQQQPMANGGAEGGGERNVNEFNCFNR